MRKSSGRSYFLLAISCLQCMLAAAQKDSSSFKLGAYIDTYYATYTDSVGSGKFQKFPASSPRSNTFGVNIAQVSMQYNSSKIRSAITLHAGDIPTAAWSPVYNYIQEAYAGVKLCKNLWVDGGFFKTHIGTEALLPKDNIASSISIITFYEPWWQAGGRLTYRPNEKFQVALYLVNGYNQFVGVNKNKAAGLAVSYALGDKGSIAYNNFISDDTPDNVHVSHTRFLNNLVFTYTFFKKLTVLAGMDIITQQHSKLSDSTKAAIINSYILTLKYQFTKPWSIYTRGEIFNDPSGFLTGTIVDANGYLTGYIMGGITLGTEFKPTVSSYIRLEGRQLNMDEGQNIFYTDGKFVNKRGELAITLGIWF